MHHDKPRDWLGLLPQEDRPDTGPPPRPADVVDPEALDPSEAETQPTIVVVREVVDLDAPVRRALETLNVRLRRLCEMYPAEPTPINRRTATTISLESIIEFINETLPDGRRLTFALADTLYALTNVEFGHRVDWLRGEAIGGRPAGVSEEIAAWRGRYASIVELLHREGRSVENAAKDVASHIPKSSPVWGSGAPDWRAVKRWRDYDVKPKNSPEREGYEAGLALAAHLPGVNATEILRRMSQAGV